MRLIKLKRSQYMNKLKALNAVENEVLNCSVMKTSKERELRYIYYIHLMSAENEKEIKIGLQNSLDNIIYQLTEFKMGERDRCCFARGMTNIDVVRDRESGAIHISQTEQWGEPELYIFNSKKDFDHLLNEFRAM